MSVFSRILVAVSDDDLSKPAIQKAIQLAIDQKAKLRIAYVVEVIAAKAASAQALADQEKSLRNQADAILEQALSLATSQKVEADTVCLRISTKNDSIAEKLAREAEAWGADLMVTGSHGRSGIVRWLAGSVAESLVRAAHIPVLIVRDLDATDQASPEGKVTASA